MIQIKHAAFLFVKYYGAALILAFTALSTPGCGAGARVEHGVAAKMPDGVRLRADIYRPNAPGKFPVLLRRTPYGNTGTDPSYLAVAAEGYVVIVQEVRGRYGSEGEWYPFKYESEDGYNSVEWAAALPYSDGRVVMFGGSYVGATQMLAAIASPPHLVGIFPSVTASNYHDGWIYQGGALDQWLAESWPSVALAEDSALRQWVGRLPLSNYLFYLMPETPNLMRMQWVWNLPLAGYPTMDRANGKRFAPYFQDWLNHPGYDPYWKQWSIEEHYAKVMVPAYHMGGWYDAFLAGTIRNYEGIKAHGGSDAARRGQRLLIGPWAHGLFSPKSGEVDFGPEAHGDPNDAMFDWCDHFLKGMDNGINHEKPVKIFVMGKNVWREEDDWPLVRAKITHYYLQSGGNANGLNGDGALSTGGPQSQPGDHFVYDPINPVPTRGGPLCCDAVHFAPGPRDQRSLEARQDVLVYSTPEFKHDLEVTGPVSLVLFASSSAVDTDFTAKLVDVWPNGFAQNLTEGIIRARYRTSEEKPELMTPGKVYEFTIDLWATSNVFSVGHKLRLEVSSSNFPRFDRNLNTGEDQSGATRMVTTINTIVHDREHPSALILPIISQ